MKLRFFSVTLFLLVFGKINAQTTASHSVSMVLSDVLSVTVSNNISLSFTTVAHYTNGVDNSATPSVLTVSSNRNYKVSVKASGNFTGGPNGSSIPLTALQVRTATGNFQSVTTTDADLVTSSSGGSGLNHSIIYRADPGFGFSAGTYTTTITYTATQP